MRHIAGLLIRLQDLQASQDKSSLGMVILCMHLGINTSKAGIWLRENTRLAWQHSQRKTALQLTT